MGLAEFIFGIITNLVSEVISTKYKELDFFKRLKIDSQVKTVIAEVVEPILPFLSQEKISEDKQRRLIEACVHYSQVKEWCALPTTTFSVLIIYKY